MGEYAEMMLDGTCCACCGEYMGTDAGYPIYCPSCAPDFNIEPYPHTTHPEVSGEQKGSNVCPECGKRTKKNGLANHMRDKHSVKRRVPCPDCGKFVKATGLADHQRDAHGKAREAS